MKRIISILLALTLCISLFAVAGATEKTNIVFLRAGTDVEKRDAFEKIIANFEAANPDIDVEYREAPWGNDMETKLNTGFASGTAPDVINFSLASIGQRVPMGQYAELDSFVEGWEGLQDYQANALNTGRVGDKLYGIAYNADPHVFAINTELFEKAGLDPNNPPKTWDELKAAHEKLVVRDENGNVIQTGLGLPTSGTSLQHWMQIFCMQNGVKNLVDEANDEILFNTPEAVEALEYLDSIRKLGIIAWDSNKTDTDPFRMGTAAITKCSISEFKTMNTGDLAGKIRLISPFENKQPATFSGMHFLFMSSQSKNKEAAWKLIEFMANPESMQIWCDVTGAAPLRQSLSEAYIAGNPSEAPYIVDAISAGVGSAKVSYSNSVFNFVAEAVEKVFYERATVQEALDAAAEKLEEEIAFQ